MVVDDAALDNERLTYVAVTFTRPTLAYNEGTQLRLLGIFSFFNLTHKHALNNLQASTPSLPWGAHIKNRRIFRRGRSLAYTQISQSQL